MTDDRPQSTASELTFQCGDVTLAGSLHLPPGRGPHPLVMMLQGSGAADRDSDGFFPPVRSAFLKRRIAAFSFDKPGCGGSSGDWRHFGLEGRAAQAVAAIDLVRNHPAVDGKRVGVWGHSQGGWLAQMLAERVPDLGFAIANSGPSINVAEQHLHDCENTLRSQGHPEADIAAALVFVRGLHQAAGQGMGFNEVETEFLETTSHEPWYSDYLSVDTEDDWHHFQLLISEGYEPRDALARVECPFLAVYGGLDLLVPPWRGARESGQALRRAPGRDSTVVVFPEGDHRIQDLTTKQFVAGYLDLVGDWTAQRVHQPGETDHG